MIIKIVKIYLGLSLVLLCAVWGQFIFRQFLDLAYISQDLQALSYVVGTNYRVLSVTPVTSNLGPSVYFGFCLQGSSVSNFCPDTKGMVEDTFFFFLGSRVQSRCGGGREGCCKQITLACARSASTTLGLPPLTERVPSHLPGTVRGRPWAVCTSQV